MLCQLRTGCPDSVEDGGKERSTLGRPPLSKHAPGGKGADSMEKVRGRNREEQGSECWIRETSPNVHSAY